MGLVSTLTNPQAASYAPSSDFWYQPVGSASATGIRVSGDTAMRIPTVYRCVAIIADTIGAMPLKVFRKTDDGDRIEAPDHPVAQLLNDPNDDDTPIEFRSFMNVCLVLRGNSYSRKIVDDGRLRLVPLSPDAVTPERVATGESRFRVRQDSGTDLVLLRHEVFRLRALSLNGRTGLSLIDYASGRFGLSRAIEEFQGRVFGNGAFMGGVLQHPGKLSTEAQARLRASITEMHGGVANSGKVLITEEGMKFDQVRLSPADLALIEQAAATDIDICRWFGLPPHLVGLMTKETSWGTGMLTLGLDFVRYCLLPYLERWEQNINRDLIGLGTGYYAEHNVSSLLRADEKSQNEAWAQARQWGWLSVNEIRKYLNLNAIDGGDEYLRPLNMSDVTDPTPPPAPTPKPTRPSANPNAAHYLLLHDAAARLVRREVSRVQAIAKHNAADGDAWLRELGTFYDEHAATVASTLHIPREVAAVYCREQAATLRRAGTGAMEDWESTRVRPLVDLALAEHGGNE